MDKAIIQIMPATEMYKIIETYYSSYSTSRSDTRSYRVVAWGLRSDSAVVPLILGQRSLIEMPAETDWKIEKYV